MFNSVFKTFKSFLSGSTNDEHPSIGKKRKRSESIEVVEEDPDVQIIKVEKKRKLTRNESFINFSDFRSKMASWVKLKKKRFSDQFSSIPVTKGETSSSRNLDYVNRRNGLPSNVGHGRSQYEVKEVKVTGAGVNCAHANTYGNMANSDPFLTPSQLANVNCERRSSTSSVSRPGQSHNYSSLKCVRLKEREDYEQLLKLQSKHSSGMGFLRPSQDIDASCLSSTNGVGGNVSVFGTSNIFSQSRPSDTVTSSLSMPHYRYIPNKTPSTSTSSFSVKPKNIYQDESLRSLIARQRANLGFPTSGQKSLFVNRQRAHVDSRKSLFEATIPKANDDIVVIDDDDDDVVSIQSKSRVEYKKGEPSTSSRMADNKDKQSKVTNGPPAFMNSHYMSPNYIERITSSRIMHDEQWQRQVKEEEMKKNAYEEKRRAQNIDLERKLKYQMRIFDEEPPISDEIFIERVEEKEEEEVLPELTDDMMAMVRKALGRGPPGEILAQGFRLQLTRNDLATLAGLNWLNDEVINFYMNMLMERGEKDSMETVYAFNTFFYPKIMQCGHSAVKRWTKKVDIFAMRFILIPVHLGMHWCLMVVDMKEKTITYYDSMHGKNKDGLAAVLEYLNDESVAKKQTPIDKSEWKLITAQDNPQQLNGSDCGMFACKYAEYITRGKDITFTQENMPYFRHRMVYEIITKTLLQ